MEKSKYRYIILGIVCVVFVLSIFMLLIYFYVFRSYYDSSKLTANWQSIDRPNLISVTIVDVDGLPVEGLPVDIEDDSGGGRETKDEKGHLSYELAGELIAVNVVDIDKIKFNFFRNVIYDGKGIHFEIQLKTKRKDLPASLRLCGK